MKRFGILVLIVPVLLALGACTMSISVGGGTYANSSLTAASVAMQAAYAGSSNTSASFLGSNYYSTIIANSAYLQQSAVYFSNQSIVQNGKTYYLTGTVNFANQTGAPNTAYIYAPSLNISGPDYVGTVKVDINLNYTTATSNVTTVSCYNVYGNVGATSLYGSSMSFYY